jgi:hypothetical protein
MAGLTREQRAALMADSADGSDPIDLGEVKPPPVAKATVLPPEPPPAAPAPSSDMLTLVRALTEAMTQSSRESAQAARHPLPETYLDGGFPEKSVFSHPDGDLAHPRTVLKCPMWMGIYSDTGETKAAFEILEAACSEKERVLLNQLTPGSFRVERNDGVSAQWKVVQQNDDLGEPIRLVIAMPARWLTKEQQAQVPGQPNFLRQLTQPAA